MTTAAVLREKGGVFEFEDIAVGPVRPDEVRVRVVATGVCHTDLLVRDQLLPPGLPAVLGHEGSGIVEETGSQVRDLAVGDPVVMSPLSCGRCANCLSAHPMHCLWWGPLNLRGRRSDGSTAYHGADGTELNGHFFGQSAFAGEVVVPAHSAVKVPAEAPLELLGPLGCGLQAGAGTVLNVLKPAAGTSLAVFGAGAVGLAAVMAARLAGCGPIAVVDRNRQRLELAVELGATHALDADDPDLVEAVKRIGGVGPTGGIGVDAVVDAVGLPATVQSALGALAMGGSLAMAGSNGTGQQAAIDLTQLMGRSVHGVIEGDSVPRLLIPRLVGHFLAGRFPIDRLIRTYAFGAINEAVADAESGRTVKPVLLIP